jgi:hypothetical protein
MRMLLAVGFWLLAFGCWLLAGNCRLLSLQTYNYYFSYTTIFLVFFIFSYIFQVKNPTKVIGMI